MRLTISLQLRWADVDAYGHMNNTALVRLLEEARVRALWGDLPPGTLGPVQGDLARDDLSHPEFALLRTDSTAAVVHHEVEYLVQMPYYRDPVEVELWMGRLGTSSFDVCFEIHGAAAETPPQTYVRATTTMVLLDARRSTPRALSPEQRAMWSRIIEEPVRSPRRRKPAGAVRGEG